MSYTTCLRAATALRQMNRNLDEFVVFSFKHPIGGGQQQKMCAKSSKP